MSYSYVLPSEKRRVKNRGEGNTDTKTKTKGIIIRHKGGLDAYTGKRQKDKGPVYTHTVTAPPCESREVEGQEGGIRRHVVV